MFKIVNERPIEGQFIAVWEFGGGIWSGTFKYNGGVLLRYEEAGDYWDVAPDHFMDEYVCQQWSYVIKGE